MTFCSAFAARVGTRGDGVPTLSGPRHNKVADDRLPAQRGVPTADRNRTDGGVAPVGDDVGSTGGDAARHRSIPTRSRGPGRLDGARPRRRDYAGARRATGRGTRRALDRLIWYVGLSNVGSGLAYPYTSLYLAGRTSSGAAAVAGYFAVMAATNFCTGLLLSAVRPRV